MSLNYGDLEQCSASINFMEAVKSTHSEPFAAIAELVDNSYDAMAKNCYVSYDKKTSTIEILDDGIGMSSKEMIQVVTFGHSDKTASNIGRYGMGLKSGAFHLGQEVMVLTKKDEVLTAMLMSTKFHKEHDIKNHVYVPCPSFRLNLQPWVRTPENLAKHNFQLDTIKKYGPLGERTLEELFARIQGSSGTLLIIGWIRKSAVMNGNYILNFEDNDMKIDDEQRPLHQQSLRAYLSMLYLKQNMRIHLQGTPVRPIKICESWMAKFKAEIPTTHFKHIFQRCQDDRKHDKEMLEMERGMYVSELGSMDPEDLDNPAGEGKKAQLDQLLAENQKQLEAMELKNAEIEEMFKTDTVKVYIGIQTVNRADNGIHFFMNHRLIHWGHKKGAAFFRNEKSIGVSAIVNLNPAIFLPAISKQDFGGTTDFKLLVKKCNEKIVDFFEYFEFYWIQDKLGNLTGEDPVAEFWNKLGYADAYSTRSVQRALPFDQDRLVALKKRECAKWFTCCRCGMWKRDSSGRVKDISTNDQLQCKDVDPRRGCRTANSRLTDDEGFNMDMEKWKKIQETMQKKANAPPRPAPETPPTSSTSGPPATRSSGSRPIVLSDDEEEVAPDAPRRSEIVVGQRANEPMSTAPIFRIPKLPGASGSAAPSASSTPRNSSVNLAPAARMVQYDDFDEEDDQDELPTLLSPPPESPGARSSAPSSAPRDLHRSGPITPSSTANSTLRSAKQEAKPVIRRESSSESDEEAEPRAPVIPVRGLILTSDEEEEAEPRIPKSNQKRKMSNSSEDSSEEEEDQEDEEEEEEGAGPSRPQVTVGKTAMAARKALNKAAKRSGAKRTVAKKKKKPVQQQKYSRLDFLEEQLNAILRSCGQPPAPRGEFELELVPLVKRELAPNKIAVDEVEERVKEAGKDIEDVLEHVVGQPTGGISMPHIDNSFEKLDAVARQIRIKQQQQRNGRKGPSARK